MGGFQPYKNYNVEVIDKDNEEKRFGGLGVIFQSHVFVFVVRRRRRHRACENKNQRQEELVHDMSYGMAKPESSGIQSADFGNETEIHDHEASKERHRNVNDHSRTYRFPRPEIDGTITHCRIDTHSTEVPSEPSVTRRSSSRFMSRRKSGKDRTRGKLSKDVRSYNKGKPPFFGYPRAEFGRVREICIISQKKCQKIPDCFAHAKSSPPSPKSRTEKNSISHCNAIENRSNFGDVERYPLATWNCCSFRTLTPLMAICYIFLRSGNRTVGAFSNMSLKPTSTRQMLTPSLLSYLTDEDLLRPLHVRSLVVDSVSCLRLFHISRNARVMENNIEDDLQSGMFRFSVVIPLVTPLWLLVIRRRCCNACFCFIDTNLICGIHSRRLSASYSHIYTSAHFST